jgi:hypothetical protein
MQQENDFIEREIQKLANFLKQIILSGLSTFVGMNFSE